MRNGSVAVAAVRSSSAEGAHGAGELDIRASVGRVHAKKQAVHLLGVGECPLDDFIEGAGQQSAVDSGGF